MRLLTPLSEAGLWWGLAAGVAGAAVSGAHAARSSTRPRLSIVVVAVVPALALARFPWSGRFGLDIGVALVATAVIGSVVDPRTRGAAVVGVCAAVAVATRIAPLTRLTLPLAIVVAATTAAAMSGVHDDEQPVLFGTVCAGLLGAYLCLPDSRQVLVALGLFSILGASPWFGVRWRVDPPAMAISAVLLAWVVAFGGRGRVAALPVAVTCVCAPLTGVVLRRHRAVPWSRRSTGTALVVTTLACPIAARLFGLGTKPWLAFVGAAALTAVVLPVVAFSGGPARTP